MQTLGVVLVDHRYFFKLTSPQQLTLVTHELNLERWVAMVPEALPYDTDPTSQLRFLGTPVHLHEHAKLHVLCPHELPSLEAKEVWWRISDKQSAIFAILGVVVAPGVEYFVPLSPIGQLSSDGVCMIGGALFTGGHGCAGVEPFPSSAFDHDTLGTPLVDLAEFHVLNFIARFGALDHLSHWYSFPFPTFGRAQQSMNIKAG